MPSNKNALFQCEHHFSWLSQQHYEFTRVHRSNLFLFLWFCCRSGRKERSREGMISSPSRLWGCEGGRRRPSRGSTLLSLLLSAHSPWDGDAGWVIHTSSVLQTVQTNIMKDKKCRDWWIFSSEGDRLPSAMLMRHLYLT